MLTSQYQLFTGRSIQTANGMVSASPPWPEPCPASTRKEMPCFTELRLSAFSSEMVPPTNPEPQARLLGTSPSMLLQTRLVKRQHLRARPAGHALPGLCKDSMPVGHRGWQTMATCIGLNSKDAYGTYTLYVMRSINRHFLSPFSKHGLHSVSAYCVLLRPGEPD